MAGAYRLGTTSMVLATVWTTAGRVAEAQLAPLPLTVAIHDSTWRRGRAWRSAICRASLSRTRLATCSFRRIRTPQGSWVRTLISF